jgi:hypothetical protein
MSHEQYPAEFVAYVRSVKDKRPKIVIEHILQHGFITTEELAQLYGYNHAPRAVRDVIENCIPIESFKATNAQGRTIAAYRFGDPAKLRPWMFGGRKALQKFKKELGKSGWHCGLCLAEFASNNLQVDHRVPYEVQGDVLADRDDLMGYMLLCRPCNRAKSWACEHCENWLSLRRSELCLTCFWAAPESYSHIVLQDNRRVDLIWMGQEVSEYDSLRQKALRIPQSMPDYIKELVRKHLRDA